MINAKPRKQTKSLWFYLMLFGFTSQFSWAENSFMFPSSNAENIVSPFSQYNYMVGSWRIDMQMKNKQGEFVALPNPAHMQAFFHQDNKTLQTLFTAANNFYSTDLRTYEKATDSWRVQFLNANAQRWQSFYVKQTDNKMTAVIRKGYSGKEKFDVKTEQRVVDEDTFISDVFYSFDKGESWQHVYIMTYKKLKDE